MIKFVYEIDGHKKYIFRYNTERSSASVTHPNSTTSEVDRIKGIQMFGDWVDSILGTILPTNTLSLFQYVFDKEINSGGKDFTIQASYLVSNCMSDAERDTFKANAIQLDNEYFAKTGLRFQLDSVQIIYATRHKINAQILLEQFNEVLRHS